MDNIRNDTAKQYRNIRKILHSNNYERDNTNKTWHKWVIMAIGSIIFIVIVGWLCSGCAYSYEIVNVNKLANAIYYSEGGSHTRWPYGIKHHYKHTSPRQACINTIEHRLQEWDGQGSFIKYLGLTYSPPDINPNWVRMVIYFYNKGE